jgi:urate oxidase
VEAIEEFCLHVADHFLTYNPQVTCVLEGASETLWTRVPLGAKSHPPTFVRAGEEKRRATLDGTRNETSIRSEIDNLVVLKTTNFVLKDFRHDLYTTLKDSRDLILLAVIRAN